LNIIASGATSVCNQAIQRFFGSFHGGWDHHRMTTATAQAFANIAFIKRTFAALDGNEQQG
jgi:hypothetical protein